MTHANLNTLIKRLGYTFQTEAIFKEALTHRSAGKPHNERLEFLGDAVLNLVIANELLNRHPTLKEGEISPLRASLVQRDTLAAIAKELSLGECLFLGPGEIKTEGVKRTSLLANALEALFGAVFVDGGFEAAERLILSVYHSRLNSKVSVKDAKTELQEYLHANKISLPIYELIQSTGAAHAKHFHVVCTIQALDLSKEGRGTTRRKAEQEAAQAILTHLKK